MSQKVNLSSVTLGVGGMTCGSCVQSIEQRIKSLPGVINIKVNAVFAKIKEQVVISSVCQNFLLFCLQVQVSEEEEVVKVS